MTLIEEIQEQVGQWSRDNFGAQETDLLTVMRGFDGKPTGSVALGSLAPLLGLFEEAGELCASPDATERLDAVGDILIYLCDYTYRERVFGLRFSALVRQAAEVKVTEEDCYSRLVGHIGKLAHCTLKRLQRIRGFDDFHKYSSTRDEHIVGVLSSCRTILQREFNKTLEEQLESTWTEVVRKRNWKTNPQAGH